MTEALPSNKEVLEDTVAMMSSTDRVAVDVATVLDDVGQDVFLANQVRSVCLHNSFMSMV